MLDQAFEALKTYEWGTDPRVLWPLDEAIVKSHGSAETRTQLEQRLVDLLEGDVPRAAKDYICRRLMVIGTAGSVPALAALLSDPKLSHMGRYALERIAAPEAAAALRDALPKLDGALKIGAIGSLGVRQDEDSVNVLAGLLADQDAGVARAAAVALGAIRSPAAAKALAEAKPTAAAQQAATDALLACAEALLKRGDKLPALNIYKGLAGEDQPRHVRLAATRGILACAGN